MDGCERLGVLREWSKQGNAVELESELTQHVPGCEQCAAFVESIRHLRSLAESLPAHVIGEERQKSMRFVLMAEARQKSAPRSVGEKPAWLRLRWLSVAFALGLAGLASAMIGLRGPGTLELPQVKVALAPGAAGEAIHGVSEDTYVLNAGVGEFSVAKLAHGRRYRVLAGDGAVDVLGTRFRVHVADGKLLDVDAYQGHVTVWLRAERVADLAGGQSWQRPADVHEVTRAAGRTSTPALDAGGAAPTPTLALDEDALPVLAPSASRGEPTALETPRARTPLPRSAREHGDSQLRPSARASNSAAEAVAERAADATPQDVAFAEAWQLLNAGDAAAAARKLDALASSPALDAARHADVLYWAAQAHARAGNSVAAQARAQRLLREHPQAFRAPDAALLLGEAARARGDIEQARSYFERAENSNHAAIRARARRALALLPTSTR